MIFTVYFTEICIVTHNISVHGLRYKSVNSCTVFSSLLLLEYYFTMVRFVSKVNIMFKFMVCSIIAESTPGGSDY